MVISCSALNCKNRQHPNRNFSFHRFPLKNETLLRDWLVAMRRESFVPTKYSYICSNHFTQDAYELRPDGARKTLKSNSIPSIFKFSDKERKPRHPRTVGRSPVSDSNTSVKVIEPFPLKKRKPPCPSTVSHSPVSDSNTSTDDLDEFSLKLEEPSCSGTINSPLDHTSNPSANALGLFSLQKEPSACSKAVSSFPVPNNSNANDLSQFSLQKEELCSTSIASASVLSEHNYPFVQNGELRLEKEQRKALRRRIRTVQQKIRRKKTLIEFYHDVIERLKQTCPKCGS